MISSVNLGHLNFFIVKNFYLGNHKRNSLAQIMSKGRKNNLSFDGSFGCLNAGMSPDARLFTHKSVFGNLSKLRMLCAMQRFPLLARGRLECVVFGLI